MVRSKSPLGRVFGLHIPVLVIVLFALGPYLWAFVASLSPDGDMRVRAGEALRYFPEEPTTENYTRLFDRMQFLDNLLDSVIVASFSMLFGLALSVTASFSFSRFRFFGRRYLLLQFLVINMFPVVLLLIPLFVIMSEIGMVDTHISLVLAYATFTIPFSTWMMTSFFNAIPKSLDDQARVDGCTRFGAMVRIIFPIASPGISATGIYIFITSWNEFVFASVLTGRDVQTIPVALQQMVGQHRIAWGFLTAGGVISAIPVVVLFFFIQKRLISGMTAGAVKA